MTGRLVIQSTRPRDDRNRSRGRPRRQHQLSGLYTSGGGLYTHCEAEVFRRITFFPRPADVLRPLPRPPRRRCCRLLGASDQRQLHRLGTGEAAVTGAQWKILPPSRPILFALVAGHLSPNRDRFTTCPVAASNSPSGCSTPRPAQDGPRNGEPQGRDGVGQRVYGREYDLDQFNLVAVSDFNMGRWKTRP